MKIEESLKNLRIKREGNYKKPHNSEIKTSENELPQYFDIYDKPKKHYRSLFKPDFSENVEDDINGENSKVYFSTPQEHRHKKKQKILTNLNSLLSQLKNNEVPLLENSLKKVRFHDENRVKSSPTNKTSKISMKIQTSNEPTNEIQEKDDGFFTCTEGCGRRFTRSVLTRHTKICQNVFLNKKTPFDMTKQRKLKESKDLENRRKLQQQEVNFMNEKLELLKKEKELKDSEKNKPENFPKWKKQSEALRAVMNDNKKNLIKFDSEFIREGLNKGKYVRCEGCGRRFNENAAERHVNKCIEKTQYLKLHKRKMII